MSRRLTVVQVLPKKRCPKGTRRRPKTNVCISGPATINMDATRSAELVNETVLNSDIKSIPVVVITAVDPDNHKPHTFHVQPKAYAYLSKHLFRWSAEELSKKEELSQKVEVNVSADQIYNYLIFDVLDLASNVVQDRYYKTHLGPRLYLIDLEAIQSVLDDDYWIDLLELPTVKSAPFMTEKQHDRKMRTYINQFNKYN